MTFVIAEIGINHNGDIEIAKKLIEVAKNAGCDAVKFQKRTIEKVYSKSTLDSLRESPWGNTTRDQKLGLEFGKKEYDEIDKYCIDRNIRWSASPWDLDSLNFLNTYNVPFIKIPSALITDLELIKKTTETGKKIIISTGMSTLDDVDAAVNTILNTNKDADYSVLHCNSSYPAPNDDLNLKCINTLKNRYNCEVGYSGHEFGLTTTIASICMGANIIERHITLDRTMWGTDQMCSVEPQGLIKLVRGINELNRALGDGIKVVTETEKPIREKLRK